MFSSSVRNIDPTNPSETEAAVKRYMQAVKQELHCSKAQKTLFLRQMEDSIFTYISENSTASMEDLTKEFGTPADIAKSFLEEADPAVIGKSLRHGRKIFWAVLAVVLIVAAIVIGIYAFDLWRSENYRGGQYVEEVTRSMPSPPNEVDSIVEVY